MSRKSEEIAKQKNKIQQLLIGKKIVAIRGYDKEHNDKRYKDENKAIDPDFILFDDGETLLELESQSYYDYHDCDGNAQLITIRVDRDRWHDIMTNKCFKDASWISPISVIDTRKESADD